MRAGVCIKFCICILVYMFAFNVQAGSLDYECITPAGETHYSDKACSAEERCLKWGQHGFAEANCTREHFAVVKAAEAQKKEQDCRESFSCWGDKLLLDAAGPCERLVEQSAKWQFKWDSGILAGPSFAPLMWSPKGGSAVVFSGDRVLMQNGFGAWQRMKYSCTYEQQAGVIDFDIEPAHG